jgi:hypothetical protein
MYDTTLSQKYIKDMGLCEKKIKDVYPKKVCHMTRHVKKIIKDTYPKEGMPHAKACQKKEGKKKIAPYPKRKKKERWCIQKEFIHHPPKKNPHTCTS